MTSRLGMGEHRAGVLVPAANPTVEPELRRLLPTVSLDFATMTAEGDLAARLAAYRGDTAGLDALARSEPAAVYIACTGSSYPVGLAGDQDWSARAAGQVGVPVVTAAGALVALLRTLGVARLTLVSPYPDWLTEQCVAFWRAAGWQVNSVLTTGGSDAIYDTRAEHVHDLVATAATAMSPAGAGGDRPAVLVAGTGAPTLSALDALTAQFGDSVPVLVSSNLAGAWALGNALDEPSTTASWALRRIQELTSCLT